MYNKNKKAVTEITSFMFLTLLVIVVSMSAYFILQNVLENNIATFDRNHAETFLKKFNQKSIELISFDNSTITMQFSFTKGSLIFKNNQLIYQSLITYSENSTFCFSDICYYSINGFERMYYNLTNSYTFKENITLIPGNYLLLLTNIKNGKKIEIKFK